MITECDPINNTIPLLIANKAVVISFWPIKMRFPLTSDPLASLTIEDLAGTTEYDYYLRQYNMESLLFLLDGTVLAVYPNQSKLEKDRSNMPLLLCNSLVVPIVGNLKGTIG